MNKDLKDRYFVCPDEIINKLSSIIRQFNEKSSKGYKRAADIIQNKRISYQQMKRMKNYFDSYEGNGQDDEYKLNGGDLMKAWVNNALGNARNTIHDIKKSKMEGGIENAFIKNHTKDKDNANPTKVNIAKPHKGKQSDNIFNDRVVYAESIENELSKIKYLIEYMNNDKKIIK
jgi:hypothetical protein